MKALYHVFLESLGKLMEEKTSEFAKMLEKEDFEISVSEEDEEISVPDNKFEEQTEKSSPSEEFKKMTQSFSMPTPVNLFPPLPAPNPVFVPEARKKIPENTEKAGRKSDLTEIQEEECQELIDESFMEVFDAGIKKVVKMR